MSIEEKQLFTNSDTLKSYTELLNSTNSNDLRHISESPGYFNVDNLPEKLTDIFEYSASVFIFVPNPEIEVGHWCLFTCLEEDDDKIYLEYFDPQRYHNPNKYGDAQGVPTPLIKLFDNDPRLVEISLCPVFAPLQEYDTASCGRWCILRQQMLHIDLLEWFRIILNICNRCNISTEVFIDTFVCPVVGERE